MVLELIPASRAGENLILGPGYRVLPAGAGEFSCEILTRGVGGSRRAKLVTGMEINAVEVDESRLEVEPGAQEAVFTFKEGERNKTRVRHARLRKRKNRVEISFNLEPDPGVSRVGLVLAVKGIDAGKVLASSCRFDGNPLEVHRLEWKDRRWSPDLITPVYPPHEVYFRYELGDRGGKVEAILTARRLFSGSVSAYLLTSRRPAVSVVNVLFNGGPGGVTGPPVLPGRGVLREVVPVLKPTEVLVPPAGRN